MQVNSSTLSSTWIVIKCKMSAENLPATNCVITQSSKITVESTIVITVINFV